MKSMRTLHRVLVLSVLGLAIGCASSSQQVVGVWKGDIIPPAEKDKSTANSDSEKLGKALAEGISSFMKDFVGPLTLEFNADGKYKASVRWGSSTGTYTVSGDTVSLTPDDKSDKNGSKMHVDLSSLKISADGKTLSTVKEFKSDSDTQLVLKKQ